MSSLYIVGAFCGVASFVFWVYYSIFGSDKSDKLWLDFKIIDRRSARTEAQVYRNMKALEALLEHLKLDYVKVEEHFEIKKVK